MGTELILGGGDESIEFIDVVGIYSYLVDLIEI